MSSALPPAQPLPLPVVVVGAGPVGLAAAAHLLQRGLEPLVLEAGDDVASSLRSWGHVRLFSPWRYDVDKEAAKLLEAEGWHAPPPSDLPTGKELVDLYLRPLASTPALRDRIRLRHRVTAISRAGIDKVKTAKRGETHFIVRVAAPNGEEHEISARAVLDASGTWSQPNPIGAAGLPALGEVAAFSRQQIHYGIPDMLAAKERARYAGRTTLVVGSGHSAANSILALAEIAASDPRHTRIVWTTRANDLTRAFGGGDRDGLPARGKLGSELRDLVEAKKLTLVTGFSITKIERSSAHLRVSGLRDGEPFTLAEDIDLVIGATGQRPDLDFTRELRLDLDPALESAAKLGPLIDPNEHSCGTVRPHGAIELAHEQEPGFYAIGNKSYGRAPTFLLATGYEQARSVAAMLAGDREAALRVELDLPETGVCSIDNNNSSKNKSTSTTSGGCCVPEKPARSCC
jgi:hypothetical protein